MRSSRVVVVVGETGSGKTTQLPKMALELAQERLAGAGLEVSEQGGDLVVDFVNFGSAAEDAGIQFGWTIDAVQIELERPPKELMFIPALLLLGLVAFAQLRLKAREDAQPQPA